MLLLSVPVLFLKMLSFLSLSIQGLCLLVYLPTLPHIYVSVLFALSLSVSLSHPPPPLLHSNCNLIRFALLVFSPSHATFTFTWLAARALASLVIVVPRIFTQSCSAILSPSGRDQHYRLRSPPLLPSPLQLPHVL